MPLNPVTTARARAVAVSALLTCLLAGFASSAPTARAAAVASHFRLALTTPPQLPDVGAVAHHDEYVVLQPWEFREARRLKAANPGLVVLVYQNFASMTQGSGLDATHSSGVTYAQARASHPGWFLTSPSGIRIRVAGYPYLWMANIGNVGYQRQWARSVVGLLRHGPWDGVFMDNVDAGPEFDSGRFTIAAYPTDAAYQAAVRAMLAYVGPRVRATGKISIANIGEWVTHPAVARQWLRYVDGAMDEKFVKWSPAPGQGYRGPDQWLDQVREMTTTEAMGKRFLAVTAATAHDTRAQLFGWASILLAADGRASYLAASDYTGRAVSLSAYGARLGAPQGRMTEVAGGAWERRFARGLVVVNPSSSTVKLSFGIPLSGSGLLGARSATLASDSALVLTRGGGGHHRAIGLLLAAVIVAGGLGALLVWRRRAGRAGSGWPRPAGGPGSLRRRSDARPH